MNQTNWVLSSHLVVTLMHDEFDCRTSCGEIHSIPIYTNVLLLSLNLRAIRWHCAGSFYYLSIRSQDKIVSDKQILRLSVHLQ